MKTTTHSRFSKHKRGGNITDAQLQTILDDAFDKVHFPTGNWKDPIFCRVHQKDLKAVEAAIIVNCGCVAETWKDEKDDWEDMYFVKADGYYLSVGA